MQDQSLRPIVIGIAKFQAVDLFKALIFTLKYIKENVKTSALDILKFRYTKPNWE